MTNTTIAPKKGSRKKSGFYHAVNEIIPHKPSCAELLGVTVEQIEEWMETGNDLAEKYLRLWDKKYINIQGWEGFCFSRGMLKYKGKSQWSPDGLLRDRRLVTHEREPIFTPSRIDLKTQFREIKR